MSIEVLKYERTYKGKVIGFVDIQLPKWNVIIRRIAHLQSAEKRWFNFPSFKVEEGEKAKYFPYFEFSLGTHNQRFFEALDLAVKAFCEKHKIAEPQELNLDSDMPF